MSLKLISVNSAVLLVSVLLTGLIVRSLYQAYTSPLRDVPGPFLARFTRFWLFGAISARTYEKTNVDLHRKYGPVVRIAPNEYSIDDPEAAKIIYRSRDQLVKAHRYSAWGMPTGEQNMFVDLDIKHHASRRRETAQLFSISTLMNIEYQLDPVMKFFFEKLDAFADGGEPLDMAAWLQYYAFDAVGALTFGKSIGFLEKGGDIADIIETIHTYSRYGSVVGVFSEWHYTIFSMLQMTAPAGPVGIAYIQQFATGAIADMGKLAEKGQLPKAETQDSDTLKSDYLSTLYERQRKDPDAFKQDDILFHILSNVIAGAETTGISLSAAVYYFCKHSLVVDKLRQELATFEKNRKPNTFISTSEALNLPYLQAVVKETLRLWPATGLNMPRVIPQGGMTLANRFFPEGAVVGINSWVAHANCSVFGPDADQFRPERWITDQASVDRMEQYFFTFGRGPRTCLGKAISLMEMSKLIPELVLRYNMQFVDAEHPWTVANDWFVRQTDFKIKITKRKV